MDYSILDAKGKYMDPRVKEIIESPYKAYMVVTGGGTEILPMLLHHGGASSFLLEFITPYCTRAFDKFLYNGMSISAKDSGVKYCSPNAALMLAERALTKGHELTESNNIIGIAVTASLNKHTPQRDGRVNQAFLHISNVTLSDKNVNFHANIKVPSAIDRPTQERIIADWVLDSILEFVQKTR